MEIDGTKSDTIYFQNNEEIKKFESFINSIVKTINEGTYGNIWTIDLPYSEIITGSFQWVYKTKQINDVDLLIPLHSAQCLKEFFERNNVPHVKYGTKVHAIFPYLDKNVQFDFGQTPFYDNRPSEWSYLSTFQSYQDSELGIKGVWHKLLLGSLTAAWNDVHVISIAYGLRIRDGKTWNAADYLTNVPLIWNHLLNFDERLTFQERMEMMVYASNFGNSVSGILILMEKYYSPEQIDLVFNKFAKRIKDYKLNDKYIDGEEDKIRQFISTHFGQILPAYERARTVNP